MREKRREESPQERLRNMILVLDSSLAENTQFMEAIVGELEEMGVEIRVGADGVPGGVTWCRKQRQREITANAKVGKCAHLHSSVYHVFLISFSSFSNRQVFYIHTFHGLSTDRRNSL